MPDTHSSGQGSSNGHVAWLAWAWCALIVVSAVRTWVVLMLNRPADDNILQAAGSATTFLGFIAFGVTGALILSRRRRCSRKG